MLALVVPLLIVWVVVVPAVFLAPALRRPRIPAYVAYVRPRRCEGRLHRRPGTAERSRRSAHAPAA